MIYYGINTLFSSELPLRSLLHNDDLYTILNSSYTVNSRSSKSATKNLGVAQAFKNQFTRNLALKKTYSCQLDLKRLKHARGSRVGLSLFIYTIPNHRQPKLQNLYFHKKTCTGLCLERFSKIIIWNSH